APITITLFEDIRLRPPGHSGTQEDARLLGRVQPHTLGEHNKIAPLDASRQAAIDTRQRPQSGSAIRIDLANEPSAFPIKPPGSLRFESKQFPDRRSYRAAFYFRDGASEAREIFARDIYAAKGKIGANVTQNIRKLE